MEITKHLQKLTTYQKSKKVNYPDRISRQGMYVMCQACIANYLVI